MKQNLLILCWVIGILHCHTAETDSKLAPTQAEPTAAAQVANIETTNTATKDKRQIGSKDTEVYANHRSDAEVDDPETPQETIYGPKPNQFIIRPIAPHQHQQHEDQQQPQLRNYPATIRPHSSQLLEQSQEIQHFAYLQDISRNHAKTAVETVQPSKSPSSQPKKSSKSSRSHSPSASYRNSNANAEEAEQRYAVAIQPPQHPHYQPGSPYPLPSPIPHQQGQQPHPYQVIPEEQFLKLIEEELQARAYHDEQIRQQQAAQANGKAPAPQPTERAGSQGLGSYRQQQLNAPEESGAPQYVQYVPRHRGGPKYLPLPQGQQQQLAEAEEQQEQRQQHQPPPPHPPGIPPQLAYYQPQISYKTYPNHPLAKSSLENEIEKLLAANKPSVQLGDNSNEPSAVVHQHHQLPQPQTRAHRPHLQPKVYGSPAPTAASPTPLLDANNQPFIPSLFKFSNFQPPTPIYPTQVPPQVVEAKKLGPVVYPTQQPTAQPQPTQYYYQEIAPTPKPKAYRSKQYGNKVSPTAAKPRDRDYNYPSTSAASKYASPLFYDYERQSENQQAAPAQFHPSPPDPNQPQAAHEPQRAAAPEPPPPPQSPQHNLRQYQLPAAAPSRSSIYVSQGTGLSTPSYPTTIKPKTVEDVRQLRLPQPGGKPLTQAEFQALVDAGYPVTAVPVPVPVPYDQYVRAHPEYRNQPPVDYAQLMHRLARQYVGRRNPHPQASEPSIKIVPSPSEPQTATGVGGGSITYLRPIPEGEQKRHPREDKETAVAGKAAESEKQ